MTTSVAIFALVVVSCAGVVNAESNVGALRKQIKVRAARNAQMPNRRLLGFLLGSDDGSLGSDGMINMMSSSDDLLEDKAAEDQVVQHQVSLQRALRKQITARKNTQDMDIDDYGEGPGDELISNSTNSGSLGSDGMINMMSSSDDLLEE